MRVEVVMVCLRELDKCEEVDSRKLKASRVVWVRVNNNSRLVLVLIEQIRNAVLQVGFRKTVIFFHFLLIDGVTFLLLLDC
jgi:hypothetical protein